MKKIYTLITTAFIVFLLSSCSSTMSLTNSSIVPGAEGKVKSKKDDNNNYVVTVNVVNLPDSKKLSPPRNTYVVWMETEGNALRNIGQIQPSSGFLSKTYKGELKATSISKPTRVFITAEEYGNVQNPSNLTVLTTQ